MPTIIITDMTMPEVVIEARKRSEQIHKLVDAPLGDDETMNDRIRAIAKQGRRLAELFSALDAMVLARIDANTSTASASDTSPIPQGCVVGEGDPNAN